LLGGADVILAVGKERRDQGWRQRRGAVAVPTAVMLGKVWWLICMASKVGGTLTFFRG